ncbi:MAG: oligosaccharide flippase family protein [Thermoguttaceae bacterium]
MIESKRFQCETQPNDEDIFQHKQIKKLKTMLRILSWTNSPTLRHLIHGSYWSVCGAVVLQGLTLVAYILTARLVGKETFGEFGLIKSTATTFATYALFGMGITAAKYIPEWLHSNREDVGRIIALNYVFTAISGFIFSLALFLAAPWMCDQVVMLPNLVGPLRLGAVLIFLVTIMTSQTSVLSGFQHFKAIAITSTATGLLTIPFYVCGAVYGGVFGLILAMIATTCLNISFNAYFIAQNKKKYGIVCQMKGCAAILPILWKFGLPSALTGFIGGPVLWVCYLVLTRQPHGISEMAVLTACMQLYMMTIFIQSQTWRVFMTRLSETVGQRNKQQYYRIVRLSFFLNAATSLVVVVPLILLSNTLLGLYGSEYIQGRHVLVTFCFSSIAFSLNCVPSLVLNSHGKAWKSFVIAFCGNLLMVIMAITLVERDFGAWGIALAHLSNYLLQCILSFLYLFLFDPFTNP